MQNTLKSLLVLLCAAMPILTMTTQLGASPAFYVIALVCLILLCYRAATPLGTILTDYRWVLLAYAVPILAMAVSLIGHGKWSGTDFEGATRFSVGLPLLLLGLMQVDRRQLKRALWGIYIAALAAAAYTLYLALPDFQRALTYIYNAVSYGNIMLLMAVISLFSLRIPLTTRPRLERAFKLLTAVLTFGGFMLTQTRSGWVAMPVFILLGIILDARLKRPLHVIAWLIGILVVVVAIGASSTSLRDRVEAGYTQTMNCAGLANNTTDSSVCIRFQLWRAAWAMFRENPVIGLGDGSLFQQRLETVALPEGVVSPYVASDFGEPHNDMMHVLSGFGFLAGLGLLLVYFAPAWVFLRRLATHHPPEVRAAAAMGAAFCLGFAIFGLTEFMFRGMRTIGFYTMFVALFLTLSDPRKYQRDA